MGGVWRREGGTGEVSFSFFLFLKGGETKRGERERRERERDERRERERERER